MLVKKVLIRDRRTAEIWYRLPQESPVRTLSDLVAPTGQYANQVKSRERGLLKIPAFRISRRNPAYQCRKTCETDVQIKLYSDARTTAI